jgi:hypothetical protein
MLRKIFFATILIIQALASVAQADKKIFLVTKIDSLSAYYIVTALDIKDRVSRDLFLEKEKPLPDSVAHFNKITIGRCYLFEIKHMYAFITDEDKKDCVILPHAPFYVGERLISTASYRPFEAWNTIDLYIKQEDCLDNSCFKCFKSNSFRSDEVL